MYALYDTRKIHPLDRYDHYLAGAAAELAPVAVDGRPPGHLLAAMSVARIGDFEIEAVTWAADSQVVTRRTDDLIKASDPECYRIFVSANGRVRMEQAGQQVEFRPHDIALYDLSCPWWTIHSTGPTPMRVVMLTFPRRCVPIPHATVRPLVGAAIPRSLPGRGLIAQFLIGLTETADQADANALVDVLRECTAGLIRQRLRQPDGITPRTRRLLQMERIRGIIHRHLGEPALDPDRIAQAANISRRYLHTIFQGGELTPMRLVKRMRLEACRRSLQDPALGRTPIKDIVSVHGYRRPDQFARDFKQMFGISANRVRELADKREG